MGFASLTIVQPGLVGGDRDEFRLAERIVAVVIGALGELRPRRYRMSPAAKIVDALIEGAVAGVPVIHVIDSAQLAAGR